MKKESNKNFNFLLTASAFSNLADGIAGFAYPWLFSLITRDPLLISLTVLLATLPQLIFVLFAGVIADKFNRKSILIFTRILQVLLTLSFILLIYFNLDSIPKSVPTVEPEFNRKFLLITAFYIGAFIFGMLEVTRDNAAQSFLPQIVSKDEFEKGSERIKLNFGHTFGHSFEASLGYSKRLNHGEAVILGMMVALKFSNKNKFLNINDYKLISDHYKNSKLPSDIKKYFKSKDLDKIIKFMKTDKKNNSDKIKLVLLKKMGQTILNQEYSVKNLNGFLKNELID